MKNIVIKFVYISLSFCGFAMLIWAGMNALGFDFSYDGKYGYRTRDSATILLMGVSGFFLIFYSLFQLFILDKVIERKK